MKKVNKKRKIDTDNNCRIKLKVSLLLLIKSSIINNYNNINDSNSN